MKTHSAQLRYLRIAPRKVRSVATLIKGMPLQEAEVQLSVNKRRGSEPLLKLLRSSKAGAREKNLDPDRLYVKEIRVDGGPMLKRYMARARGSSSMIQKKSSHVMLVLEERSSPVKRFTIAPPKKKKKGSLSRKEGSDKKSPEAKREGGEAKDKKERRGFFKRTFGRKTG